jgi:hypothetical protein
MHQIIVSTWHRPSGRQQQLNQDQRLLHLKSAVEAAAGQVATAGLDANGLIKGIFVAPEYHFARQYAGCAWPGGPTVSRSISRKSEKALRNNLIRNLSTKHRRLLIFPGTVAWTAPYDSADFLARYRFYVKRARFLEVSDAENFAQIKEAWSIDLDTGLWITITDAISRQEKGCTLNLAGASNSDIQNEQTSNPAFYANMVFYARMINEIGYQVVRQRERVNSGSLSPQRTMFNTAHGLLNGQVVVTYNKQGNFHEEVGDDHLIFAPGGRSGITEIEGVRFGLEVCLDHAMGTLARQSRADRPIDVQVVLSDYVDPDQAHQAAREGGYFVHASTNASYTGVWKKDGGKLVPATKLNHEDTIDGSVLTHWQLDLDVSDAFAFADTFMANLPEQAAKKPGWKVNVNANPFRSRG